MICCPPQLIVPPWVLLMPVATSFTVVGTISRPPLWNVKCPAKPSPTAPTGPTLTPANPLAGANSNPATLSCPTKELSPDPGTANNVNLHLLKWTELKQYMVITLIVRLQLTPHLPDESLQDELHPRKRRPGEYKDTSQGVYDLNQEQHTKPQPPPRPCLEQHLRADVFTPRHCRARKKIGMA